MNKISSILFKQILLVLMLGSGISSGVAQTFQNLAYPTMDATLVEIWQQAERGYYRYCLIEVKELEEQWQYVQKDLLRRTTNKDLLDEFCLSIGHMIDDFPLVCERGDIAEISGYAYHLLWEFRVLRIFLNENEYPLDVLWEMYDVHQEVLATVYDDKFGLLSWSEFMTLVNELSQSWNTYSTLTRWNADISGVVSENDQLQYESAAKVDECLSYFIASLESGFQSDFELPCDELGSAIEHLLLMHAFVASVKDKNRTKIPFKN